MLTLLPNEIVHHTILYWLDDKSLINVSSCKKSLRNLITSCSSSSYIDATSSSGSCEHIWLTLYKIRWKLTPERTRGYPKPEIENSAERSGVISWYSEYVRRAKKDKGVLPKLTSLAAEAGQTSGNGRSFTEIHDQQWRSLLLDGEEICNQLKQYATSSSENATTVSAATSIINAYTPSILSTFLPPALTETLSQLHKPAQDALVGINRFIVYKEWKALLFAASMETTAKDNQTAEDDFNSMLPNVLIEHGAILIARFYQQQEQLTTCETICSIDLDISNKLNGLAQELLVRLESRLRLFPPRTTVPKANNTKKEVSSCSSKFPVRTVLEEMKHFFRGSDQSDRSHHEVREQQQKTTASRGINDNTNSGFIPPPPSQVFEGNVQDYYNYRNSLINSVLDSGKGIPITLSIIYAAIVRRATGIVMEPVGLPGHFLLGVSVPSEEDEQCPTLYVDAFSGGKILNLADCQSIVVDGYQIPWKENMVNPISKDMVWTRMIRNLLNCHRSSASNRSRLITSRWSADEEYTLNLKMIRPVMFFTSASCMQINDVDLVHSDVLSRTYC